MENLEALASNGHGISGAKPCENLNLFPIYVNCGEMQRTSNLQCGPVIFHGKNRFTYQILINA